MDNKTPSGLLIRTKLHMPTHTHMHTSERKTQYANLEKCKDVTHISKHKTLNNNPKYAKKLSHDVIGWLPHKGIIICSLKNTIKIQKKRETRRKNLTQMKIYLFTHGRGRFLQASECKTLYNNLKKCEKDVVGCHKATFVLFQKSAKQMLHNVARNVVKVFQKVMEP